MKPQLRVAVFFFFAVALWCGSTESKAVPETTPSGSRGDTPGHESTGNNLDITPTIDLNAGNTSTDDIYNVTNYKNSGNYISNTNHTEKNLYKSGTSIIVGKITKSTQKPIGTTGTRTILRRKFRAQSISSTGRLSTLLYKSVFEAQSVLNSYCMSVFGSRSSYIQPCNSTGKSKIQGSSTLLPSISHAQHIICAANESFTRARTSILQQSGQVDKQLGLNLANNLLNVQKYLEWTLVFMSFPSISLCHPIKPASDHLNTIDTDANVQIGNGISELKSLLELVSGCNTIEPVLVYLERTRASAIAALNIYCRDTRGGFTTKCNSFTTPPEPTAVPSNIGEIWQTIERVLHYRITDVEFNLKCLVAGGITPNVSSAIGTLVGNLKKSYRKIETYVEPEVPPSTISRDTEWCSHNIIDYDISFLTDAIVDIIKIIQTVVIFEQNNCSVS